MQACMRLAHEDAFLAISSHNSAVMLLEHGWGEGEPNYYNDFFT